ncbi:hypothetical protein MHU86_1519 [Fragilaria crotonensis]|nr:hypothetical protein MHU86_1519 [Fragilaria crotonensis]
MWVVLFEAFFAELFPSLETALVCGTAHKMTLVFYIRVAAWTERQHGILYQSLLETSNAQWLLIVYTFHMRNLSGGAKSTKVKLKQREVHIIPSSIVPFPPTSANSPSKGYTARQEFHDEVHISSK